MIERTVRSIFQSKVPERWSRDVVVVDNASSDSTPQVLEKLRSLFDLKVVAEPKPGLSYARNCGIAHSSGEWIVFLDDDVEIPADYFFRITEGIAAFPHCAFFGTGIIPIFEGPLPRWVQEVATSEPWYFSALDLGNQLSLLHGDSTPFGASMILRRGSIIPGAFSPDYGFRHGALFPGEEIRVFSAMRQHGYQGAWIPNAAVLHFMPESRRRLRYLVRRAIGQGRLEAHLGPIPRGRFAFFGMPAWIPLQAARELFRAAAMFAAGRPRWAVHLLASAKTYGFLQEARTLRQTHR